MMKGRQIGSTKNAATRVWDGPERAGCWVERRTSDPFHVNNSGAACVSLIAVANVASDAG
jgi:hypothetical protein